MANYVLSPGAARRLKEMMRGRMTSGRIEGDPAHVVDERDFEHPYKLTYAASAGAVDEQTGEADGAWIIWLPDGCLVIDGETVDLTANLTAANNYPSGWYDLTDIFDGTDPDDFDLYLDASASDPKFVIDPDDADTPVLIAIISGKSVKGVVESALVIGGGNKKPFDIVTEEVNGEPVKKIVRCVFDIGAGKQSISDATITEGQGGTSIFLVVRITPPANHLSGSATINFAIVCVDYVNEPTVDTTQTGHENDSMQCAPLYDLDENGAVICDYRDAWMTLNRIGIDNDTISYGDDGQSVSFLHLKDFYNANSNLSEFPSGTMILVRVPTQGGGYTLAYAPTSLFVTGGGGGHGGANDDVSVGGSGGMFAWTADTRTIGPGGCMVGRKFIQCNSGIGSGKADGLYQLKVELTSSGATLEVVSGVSLGTSPSGNISYIPIYQISSGKISADYRGAFVCPAYE